jgi:hypothetical protein
VTDYSSDAPRRIVLENMLIAANPLAPADPQIQYELVDHPNADTAGSQGAQVSYPGIRARLILPLTGTDQPQIRADKLYEVHYHLLNLASLSDYEEIRVYYTAYGLIRDMGWTYNGRQTQLIRSCVNYLRYTELEYDGYLPDPRIPDQATDRTGWLKILIGGNFPSEEKRRGGGRHLSYVDYHPHYLAAIRNSPTVQLDTELLMQIPGTLGKAFYRTASWLRASGEDRIDLAELFERVGSNRQYIAPAYAERAFSGAWETMQQYRYLKDMPRIERKGTGQYDIIFEWGNPVHIPHRTDVLYRSLLEAGVNSQTAEQMLREDRTRVLRIMQAYRAGALGQPHTTVAALIVGAFRTSDWDFGEHVWGSPQMDLLASPSRRTITTPAQQESSHRTEPTELPNWDLVIDWVALRNATGSYASFMQDVLTPVLLAGGVENPGHVLTGKTAERIQAAFEVLGWTATIDATYAAAAYLGPSVERPVAYIATVLANEAQKHAAPVAPASPPTPSRPKVAPRSKRVEREAPQPATPERRSTGGPTAIGESASVAKFLDVAQFRLSNLRSWLADLEQRPTRETASAALRFVEERRAGKLEDIDVIRLLDQIEVQAKAILA